jgi:hypothetical protein
MARRGLCGGHARGPGTDYQQLVTLADHVRLPDNWRRNRIPG